MISGAASIVGIIGDPIAHSLSPKMHNYAFKKLNMDWAYVPFHVQEENLARALDAVRALELVGLNITIPHKEAAAKLVDELTPRAKKIRAVNTVLRQKNRLIGDNTDAPGFLNSLKEEGISIANRRIVLIGAGGAARAVAFALAESGIKNLTLLNRTIARAQTLAQEIMIQTFFSAQVCSLTEENLNVAIKNADLVVNTATETPAIANYPSQAPFYDAVYGRKTALGAIAAAAGTRVIDGLAMLVHQGALSFSLWTKQEPPVELFWQAVQSGSVDIPQGNTRSR